MRLTRTQDGYSGKENLYPFQSARNRLLNPPYVLYSGYRGRCPWLERPGREAVYSSPSKLRGLSP